jgi:hypothetical protein
MIAEKCVILLDLLLQYGISHPCIYMMPLYVSLDAGEILNLSFSGSIYLNNGLAISICN